MKAEIQKGKWTGMFGFSKRRQERAPAVEPVLRKLSVGRQMVRMEIDSAMAQFNTGLLVKDEMVLIGKPEGLEASMRRGDIARFRIPWEQKFEVRMKIYVLHLNLSNGTEAFLCRKPTSAEKRTYVRHAGRSRGNKGYEDLVWVLLNSNEFMFNH